MKLYISTFGVFDIKLDDVSLLKESSRCYKLYKLLQYFITFRNKKILPDTLIDNLWADHESHNPNNMLRAQIYRLRQFVKSIIPEGEDERLYMQINFNNGYYSLDIGERVSIDTEEFEELIALADTNTNQDIDASINYYEEALDIYKGSYLEENENELWLVPIKNYYKKLYIKTLYIMLEILKEKEDHNKIIEICQKAIAYEPQEEYIHIYLMEAMLKLGQIKDALSHYKYTTFLLNEEMTVNSSLALSNINRKIQNLLSERDKADIRNIKMKLQEDDLNKDASLCDFDYFKFLFNIEKRKRSIGEENNFLTLITLTEDLSKEELKTWRKTIIKVLKTSLRWGDIFTFWNDFQILLLLQNVQVDRIGNIERRIQDNLEFVSRDITYNITISSSLIASELAII